MPLEAGTTLGPYEIEAPRGAGGQGEVLVVVRQRIIVFKKTSFSASAKGTKYA